ncbi:hypothetical protein TWF103_001644 [Orbilia oligospora]|nr:hypothetical protein TWF103_001644 [Orbilia oligospora]
MGFADGEPTWESRVDIDGEAEGETEDGEGDDQDGDDDDDDDDDDFIKKAFLVCLALQALQALPCFALSYLVRFRAGTSYPASRLQFEHLDHISIPVRYLFD